MARWMSLMCLVAVGFGQTAELGPPRPMSVEDLFTLSELDGVVVSPDGAWIAATITRPGRPNGMPTSSYKAAGDVWVIDRRTGERRNLTDGAADGSTSWLPSWSPDGRRLAFVSSKPKGDEPRGGDNIRLHLWDVAAPAPSRIGDRGVCLRVEFRTPSGPGGPIAWLDEKTLLAGFLQPGVAADEEILYWRRGMSEAQRAWARWRDGTGPTASVLESGGPVSDLPTMSLQRIDVERGSGRTVAEVPKWDLWDLNLQTQIAVSPDRRNAAVLAVTGTIALRSDRPITDAIRTYRAGAVSLDDPSPIVWAALNPEQEHVDGELLSWSPDGREFAVSESGAAGTKDQRRVVLVVSAADGAVRDVTPQGMTVGTVIWTSGSRLLARARPVGAGASPGPAPGRWDWWRLDEGKDAVNLTASMAAAPSRIIPAPVKGRFLGIADGALWAVEDGRDAPVRVSEAAFGGGAALVPLPPVPTSEPGSADLLVTGRAGGRATLAHVTVHGATGSGAATVRTIGHPSPTAAYLAGDPRAGTIVFGDETPEGVFLWATDGQGHQAVRRLALNEHIARIAEGRRVLVPYRSADGESLQGLAILPPGAEPGKRHPVAVWVYGGLVVRDTATLLAGKNSTRPLNLELLAARGFVVLLPSVPLAPAGVKSDPLLDIPKGVIPCVDKVIELGIGDPDRLAVLGHSTGGYSTYAVVTYTNRFKAAVALSGHPDLVSLHGQFFPGERFNARPHEGLATVAFTEHIPMNLGAPPWEDLGRYLRNSPLFHFDRIRTPLMIVHGDMDGAPMQQGEEAFTGMYRQGKRARFVRYWGEGHVVASPANVRHLWSQIFDWLDTHLGAPAATVPR